MSDAHTRGLSDFEFLRDRCCGLEYALDDMQGPPRVGCLTETLRQLSEAKVKIMLRVNLKTTSMHCFCPIFSYSRNTCLVQVPLFKSRNAHHNMSGVSD